MSRAVFDKPAARLTLAEAAFLAGLIRAPGGLSPWTNLDGAVARSRVVLRRMREEGYITAAEEPAARAARLRPGPAAEARGRARRLRQAVAARAVPRTLRRRPPAGLAGRHDLRPQAPGRRRAVAVQGGLRALGIAGAPGGARRDGPGDRRRARARGRSRRAGVPLQPRDEGAAPARLRLQALRLRGGARAGDLARERAPAALDAVQARGAERVGARRPRRRTRTA